MNRRVIGFGLLSLCTGVLCYVLIYYQLRHQPITASLPASVTSSQKIGGDFILVNQHGKLFSTKDFRGKYQLIYFGYSYCPDICPLGLHNISGALDSLQLDLDEIIPVFVTIDPERDTVDALNIFATNFHSKFNMLTGTVEEIKPILKDYKVYAVKAKPDGTTADYLMDHSTLIYLMDREGKFLKSYPHTTDSQKLARDLSIILAADIKKGTKKSDLSKNIDVVSKFTR